MVKVRKWLDKYVGNLLIPILSLFDCPEVHKKTAFIQLWGMGETILTLPAIKWYKEQNPEQEVTVICTSRNKEVYEGLPYIDKIKVISLNPFSIFWLTLWYNDYYGSVYDFEEYLNISAIIAYFIGVYRIGFNHGIRAKLYDKKIYYNDHQHVVKTFCDLVGAPYPKRLEPIQYFFVKSEYSKVILFNGTAESAPWRKLPDECVNCIIDKVGFDNIRVLREGQFDLHRLAYLFSKSKCVISNDSGPMHLAAAMGAKTIGLFGPNTPKRWAPYGKGNKAIYHKRPCSPCIDNKTGEMGGCKEAWCMKSITAKEVLKCIK